MLSLARIEDSELDFIEHAKQSDKSQITAAYKKERMMENYLMLSDKKKKAWLICVKENLLERHYLEGLSDKKHSK